MEDNSKVKLMQYADMVSLQNNINKFLKDNKYLVEVQDIKFTMAMNKFGNMVYSAMIWYTKQ